MNASEALSKMLRLQRELMQLSKEERETLLAEFAQAPAPTPVTSNGAPPRSRAVRRTPARKRRSGSKKTAGSRGASNSVSALSIAAVTGAPGMLWASDVLSEVQKAKPDVNPVNVYAALHSAAKAGKLFKEMVGNKARYSRPHGGKKPPAA